MMKFKPFPELDAWQDSGTVCISSDEEGDPKTNSLTVSSPSFKLDLDFIVKALKEMQLHSGP